MVDKEPLQNVIDQSMTVLTETMVQPAPLQTVIDQSMTVLESRHYGGRGTFTKLLLTGQ